MKYIKTYPDSADLDCGTYKLYPTSYIRNHNRKVVLSWIGNAIFAVAGLAGLWFFVIVMAAASLPQ